MVAKDRLQKSLDSIKEVLREVQRLQPSVPPLHPRVRNQLQSTTRKLKGAVTEIETVMRELDSSSPAAQPD
jgi:predicted  nucleic acid-binding Zn-ribbon protein